MKKTYHFFMVIVTTIIIFLSCILIFSCDKGDNSNPDDKSDGQSSTTGSQTASQYNTTYRIWEKDAKFQYNALVSALSRKSPSTSLLVTLINNLQKAQRNMQKIRLEAMKNGIIIERSKYENVWA